MVFRICEEKGVWKLLMRIEMPCKLDDWSVIVGNTMLSVSCCAIEQDTVTPDVMAVQTGGY